MPATESSLLDFVWEFTGRVVDDLATSPIHPAAGISGDLRAIHEAAEANDAVTVGRLARQINRRVALERLWELESIYSARPADADKLNEVRLEIERIAGD